MTDSITTIISTKNMDEKGNRKEFIVPRKFQFTKESLLKTIEKVERDLAELKEMKGEFEK